MTFADITVANVKAYFGVETDDTSKDARITLMIPMAIQRVKTYCRNEFTVNTVTDEIIKVIPNSDSIFVKHRPITSVTSVVEDGVTLVAGEDYGVFKQEGRIIRYSSENMLLRPYEGIWLSTPEAVKVSYVGGLALPDDVVQVIYEIIGIFSGLRTRAYITNAGIENVVSLNSVPKEFMDILDQYVNAREL